MPKNKKKREMRKSRSTAVAAKRRAETHKVGFDNTAFKLPDDKKLFALKSDKAVRLDVIPYEVGEGNPYADKGELYYERTYFVHRSVGVDQTSYVCLNKTCGEPCPICEFRGKLMKDPDADEDLIKDLAPKERQLFNVIDTKDKNRGVQVWDMSFHLFGKKLDTEIKNSDEDDNYENFAELGGGFTLKCGIEERSFGGRSFYEVVSIGFKPRSEDYDEDILQETVCLDDILIIKDYDELKEIFLQTKDGGGNDDKKKGGKSKKEEEGQNDNPQSQGFKEEEGQKSQGFEVDDRVSAEIDGETYEGTIKKVKDEEVVVLFDDGDEQTIDCADLTKLDLNDDNWEKGDRVIVAIEGEDYPGVITSVDEDDKTANVSFDDGDTDEIAFNDLVAEPEKKFERSREKDKGKKGGNKCPGGGTFGKDTDELPECNDCPFWDECDDA